MAIAVESVPRGSASFLPVTWWESFEAPEGVRAEIIRGVLSLTPSPSDAHGVVQSRLTRLLASAMPSGHEVVPGIEWTFVERGRVAMAPQPDLMVCRWDADAATLERPPVLAVEVLSPSDVAPWEGASRIEYKRLDYADNDLEHYLEVDLVEPAVARYTLQDGELVMVDRAVGDQALMTTVPFPFELCPAQLVQ